MDQLVGQSISRYKLTNLLGEGGMGAVFKAFDVTLQRDVAIKVMHAHFARQPNFQERFLQEARTAARLNHPGIVQVYDFGQDKGQLFIVMKFIAGLNLENVLRNLQQKRETLPLAESLDIVIQVARALDYAHRTGVLHRDIKPANIMIEPDPQHPDTYRPVLTDLGLAKLAEGGMMTVEGTSMGTPAYMSPEQALGQKTDPRSDVYSLGVLLFELATGRRPFPAGSLTEAIRYHTQEPAPRPTLYRPNLPPVLEQIILKALEKDPARRFPSAGEFAASLLGVLETVRANRQPGDEAHTATQVFGGEAAGGLATQFAAPPAAAQGEAQIEGAPRPGPARQDRIQIVTKDGDSRVIAVTSSELTLGRDDDNDIQLPDPQVSRHHAKIVFGENTARVIDMNSSNGTYLGGARLLPGIAEDWRPEVVLQLGDTALRLIKAGVELPETPTGPRRRDRPVPAGETAGQRAVSGLTGAGRIGLQVDSPVLTLTPGQPASLAVTLLNQGPVVDHFRIAVEGIPARWLPTQPQAIQLMPGARQTVPIRLQPPRAPEARSGRYPVVIRAVSQDDPNQFAESRLTVTVAPYVQFTSELHPQRLTTNRAGRLTITNQGNSQETFQVSFQDRADELVFEPPSAQLRVGEGQQAAAEFRVRPRHRRLLGGMQQHPFTVRVLHPQGDAQTQNGELASKAMIPGWVIPMLGLLVVFLMAGIGFAYSAGQARMRDATATANSASTEVAAVVAGTASAVAQQTVLAGAALATEQAAAQAALLQATADFSSTQLAAMQQAGTQAAIDAQNAQNAQTSTALAGQLETMQADQAAQQQTMQAGQANQAVTATAAAQQTMQAATNLANDATAQAQAQADEEMTFLVGTWVNPSPVANQLVKLVIGKVDDQTLSFQAFNECSPTPCELGTNNNVAFTLPTTEGAVNAGGGRGLVLTNRRTIKVTRAANRQDLNVTVEIYSFLTQSSTNYFYTFKRELQFRPLPLPTNSGIIILP